MGTQGVEFRAEVDGKPPKPAQLEEAGSYLGLEAVDLFLLVDPAAATVEAWFTVTDGR